MSTIKEDAAMARIASYCATGEHSRLEVCEKLKRWGLDPKMVEGILQALETGGFIDDERFCRCYVKDKYRLSKWGRLKISQGLSLHRIPTEIVQRYLKEIDEEEYTNILRKLIETKRRSVQGKNEQEKVAKLIRFAASRGFEMRYIKQCLDTSDDD